ncbi:methionine adenosyltransferase [Candidatus Woesearchaeota archaeon]|nr:methionine adenosyltransferase [Candidatus Woesearchaeota archaeon]
MDIFIERINDPVEKRETEFVESKGIGHPDSICDAVCEACGQALAAYYIKRFGTVLHYNIDKALLVAGAARPGFNGGRILSPIKLTIAGRATDRRGKERLPVRKLIKETAQAYLRQFRLAKFDVVVDIKSAAANLEVVSKSKRPVANDTSFGASHYPFSSTEKLVIDAAAHLNSPQFRRMFPAAGPDIKVMGVRKKDITELTVAIALIGKHVKDMNDYVIIKDSIAEHLIRRYGVKTEINTLDDVTGGENSVYLTVSGLSAEMGDDGQVGRGNRHNSIITPGRPMSIEAVAGKNPRHPGRSYQIAAHTIAKELVDKSGAKSAEVQLVTDIGAPLETPKAVSIRTECAVSRKNAEKTIMRCIRSAIKS